MSYNISLAKGIFNLNWAQAFKKIKKGSTSKIQERHIQKVGRHTFLDIA